MTPMLQPAARPVEGLPIGNGRMGTLVWTTPETGENHKGVASRLETDVWSVNSAGFLTRTTMKLLSKHWSKR